MFYKKQKENKENQELKIGDRVIYNDIWLGNRIKEGRIRRETRSAWKINGVWVPKSQTIEKIIK